MKFLRNMWRRVCLHEAERHRDAAWDVHKNCQQYLHGDTHDSLRCGYCNRASAYHIDQRDYWYQRYDRINL